MPLMGMTPEVVAPMPTSVCAVTSGDESSGGGGGARIDENASTYTPPSPAQGSRAPRAKKKPLGVRINFMPKEDWRTFWRTPQHDVDLERFPAIYPFVPGCRERRTVVHYRDALTMGDIPQMRGEFARIKRDQLLIIHFLDVMERTLAANDTREFHEIPLKARRLLADELQSAGLNITDPISARWMLSNILKQHAYRYPELGTPAFIIVPLIACMIAGFVDAELNEDESQAAFQSDVQDMQSAVKCIEQYGMRENRADVLKLARAMKLMRELFYERQPYFHRRDNRLPPLCIFKEGCAVDLPDEFMAGPARFIEAQENVQKGKEFERAQHFFYLNQFSYDAARVKRFMLGDQPVISKRIEPLRVGSIDEEIEAALHIEDMLRAKGIAGCRTVEYLGLVYDAGNFYVLMKDEQAPSLYDEPDGKGIALLQKVAQALSNGEHHDLEERNALWNGGELILIDFEGHATAANLENIPVDSDALVYARLSRVDSVSALKKLRLGKDVSSLPIYRRFESLLSLKNLERASAKSTPAIAAIGDIHGNAKRLAQLLNSETVRQADRTVFLGDYFDRDRGGLAVFDILKKRDPRKNVFLWGNHDLIFMLAMRGDRPSFEYWIANGGIEFLSEVMDVSALRAAIDEIAKVMSDDASGEEIVKALGKAQPQLIEDYFSAMRANNRLNEIGNWLGEKGQLFHIDEYGMLYVHAGVRNEKDMDVGYFEGLRSLEELFRKCMQEKTPEALEKAVAIAQSFRHHLEMREYDWMMDFTKDGAPRVFEHLSKLGLRGVVYGHTKRLDIGHGFDRFWAIDLSMAEYYGGHGGVLEFGREGIRGHRFIESTSEEMRHDDILVGKNFQYTLEDDVGVLLRKFREYFLNMAGG